MKKAVLYLLFTFVFLAACSNISYSKTLEIGELVDNFRKATDIQKSQIINDVAGQEILASGIVSNVGEYDFFDITNDVKGIYYQISSQQQKTKNGVPYEVIFLNRDREAVKDIDKGERVQKDGKIVRIMDERLQISVWIFCGELTEKDQALFDQPVY